MSLLEDSAININEEEKQLLEDIPTWFMLSILSILFCGIFGIIATVISFKASSAKKRGDTVEAVYHALNAKKWAKIAFIVGGVLIALNVIGQFGSR